MQSSVGALVNPGIQRPLGAICQTLNGATFGWRQVSDVWPSADRRGGSRLSEG